MPIETARLRLVPYAPGHILALIEDPARFEERFGYRAADGMHEQYTSGEVSPVWLAHLRSAPDVADPWSFGFAVVQRASDQVIGSAGFKGAPDADGVVEIAYGVVPGVEGRGYASEAAAALISYALDDPRVRLIRAHTVPREGPSPAILRKCAFAFVGEVVDPEDGPVWRWERPRLPA